MVSKLFLKAFRITLMYIFKWMFDYIRFSVLHDIGTECYDGIENISKSDKDVITRRYKATLPILLLLSLARANSLSRELSITQIEKKIIHIQNVKKQWFFKLIISKSFQQIKKNNIKINKQKLFSFYLTHEFFWFSYIFNFLFFFKLYQMYEFWIYFFSKLRTLLKN